MRLLSGTSICAAPELNPRYGRLYAYLQDDVTRKLPSPRLVGHLLEGEGVTAADVLPRIHRREDPHLVVQRTGAALGLFDHHHGVGSLRHRGAGRDLGALAGGDRSRRHLARVDLLDRAQHPGVVAPGAERVFGTHGVAVHRRAIERRHVHGGLRRRSDDASGGLAQRHALDARHGRGGLEDQRERLVERDGLADWPHRFHRRNSLITWPSSGRMSFVMASRTAFSAPGSMKIAVPRATPAVARDSIAALPISW